MPSWWRKNPFLSLWAKCQVMQLWVKYLGDYEEKKNTTTVDKVLCQQQLGNVRCRTIFSVNTILIRQETYGDEAVLEIVLPASCEHGGNFFRTPPRHFIVMSFNFQHPVLMDTLCNKLDNYTKQLKKLSQASESMTVQLSKCVC